jgi:PST family polysaccharide transporter
MVRRLVIVNSAWLMADRVVRLGLGLIVWVWLARHFGPATFGVWNYAIAFAAMFSALGLMGMEGVVVRELLRDGVDTGAILGTTLGLRVSAAMLAAIAAVLTVHWLRAGEWLPVLLVALNAAVFVLQTAQVLDLHFQARMHSRPSVVAMNIAFLVTTVGRLALLAWDAPIEWFGVSLVVEAALAAALLWRAYRSDASAGTVWRFDRGIARRLLSETWPLLLSGLAVMAYMRLDQVMLAALAGDEAVGQFSAALRIAEVWYFIPMAIMTAAFPALMQKKTEGGQAYERYVQSLYDGMAWLGIIVAVVTSLIAPWLVSMLYGPAFSQTASILSIQIWAGVAVAMSFVHAKWLLAEGLQRYALVYTLVGAFVNVALNIVLIPRMGAIGAAWATLATQIGTLPIQLIFPKARRNFLLMLRTAGAPWRAWKAFGLRRLKAATPAENQP